MRGLVFIFLDAPNWNNRVGAAASDWTDADGPPLLLLSELQSIDSSMQRRNVEASELEMEVSG